MVDTGAEVFGSVLIFDSFVITQELSNSFVPGDVFFLDLMLPFVEYRPTIVTEMLFVIQTVPLHLLAFTHTTQLDTVVKAQWLHFDLGDHLMDQLHSLIVIDTVAMAKDTTVLAGF